MRRALPAVALLLLAASVRADGPGESAGSRRTRELAGKFLAAYRAKDEAGMAFVREAPGAPAEDPFVVANRLLGMRIEPSTPDALDAARALAARVRDSRENESLPALVEGWSALGPEALAKEAALERLGDRLAAAGERGRPGECLAAAEEGLAALRGAAPGVSAVECRRVVAALLGDHGRTEEAIETHLEAGRGAARIGWSVQESSALWQAGYLHYRRGNLPAARACFLQQLAVIEARGNPRAVAEALLWVGAAEAALGEFDGAFERVAAAVEEARKHGDIHLAARATETLGRLHAQVGRHARALALLEEARSAFAGLDQPDRLVPATALGAIGGIYEDLGRHRQAAEALRASLAELEFLGYSVPAARVRTDLGRALVALGDREAAEAAMERSLAAWQARHDRLGAAGTWEALGTLHLGAGRPGRAIECHEKALAEWEAMGHRPGAARTLASLAEDQAALGRHEDALRLATKALEGMESLGDRRGAARALCFVATAERSLGRPAAALETALRAVDLQLSLGAGLSEEDVAGLRREIHALADTGLLAARDLAAASPGDRERAVAGAFRIAESSRGLLLVEGILHRDALLSAGIPPGLRDAEAAARARVAATRRALAEAASRGTPDAAGLAAARGDLDAAYRALEEAIARIQREALRVAEVLCPRPVDLAGLRAALAPGEAAALFHLARERALVLVVTRDGADLVDLGPTAPLAAAAEEWLDLVSTAGSEEAPRAAALYDALLRPLEGRLAGTTRLLVCPDGVLAFLPFEALLRTGGARAERVVERWEVAYLPSATVFASLPRGKGPGGDAVLALGDPTYPGEAGAAPAPPAEDAALRGLGVLRRLPGTGAEVRAIADLVPPGKGTLLLRERATAAGLRAALGAAGGRLAALHLACHGTVDPERPWLTGLVLAGGEVLTLDDVCRLRVPADLVVLSACETGRGRLLEGEGAMGLARGFLFAGASRVVVSDWAVSDEATRPLMVSFYRGMLHGGLPAGAALRAAKLEALRSGGPLAHPAHWAAFVLWGLPR